MGPREPYAADAAVCARCACMYMNARVCIQYDILANPLQQVQQLVPGLVPMFEYMYACNLEHVTVTVTVTVEYVVQFEPVLYVCFCVHACMHIPHVSGIYSV